MADSAEIKRELRRELLDARETLGEDKRRHVDNAIARQVLRLDVWQSAQVVLSYYSVGAEVDTRALISSALAAGKRVALPRVIPHTRQMRWYEVYPADAQAGFSCLEESTFHVLEPPADERRLIIPQGVDARGLKMIALVPGLAFGCDGRRIGYGGGFYDIFLRDYCGVSLGLCRKAFLRDDIPLDLGLDLCVDLVICESGVVRQA